MWIRGETQYHSYEMPLALIYITDQNLMAYIVQVTVIKHSKKYISH